MEALRARAGPVAVAWVPSENLHITVKFLGQVPADRVSAVTAALRQAARMRPFTVAVGGLGAFPSVTRPKVLWAGIAEGGAELAALAARVDEELGAAGFAREARAFAPHVTVGRIRHPRPSAVLAESLAFHATRPFGRFAVDRVDLMRSELSSRAARYSELASHALYT